MGGMKKNRDKIIASIVGENPTSSQLQTLQALKTAWKKRDKPVKEKAMNKKIQTLSEKIVKIAENKVNALDPKDVEEAIRKANGWLSVTAKNLGVTVNALKKVLKNNKYLRGVLFEVNEQKLDEVEDVLYRRIIKKQDAIACMFYLKCQGQHRGWQEKPKGDVSNKPVYIKILPAFDMPKNPKGGRPKKIFAEVKVLPGQTDTVDARLNDEVEVLE